VIALSPSAQAFAWGWIIGGATLILGVALAIVIYRKWNDPDAGFAAGVVAVVGVLLAVVLFFVTLGLGGFWEKFKRERGRGDAPRTALDHVDRRAADWVVNFPDGYGNVATKCVGDGLRGFITSKASGASDLELSPDATCDGYSPQGGK
jgi:hypothetical protein